MKLRENGFLFYDDTDSFRSCVAKAVSFVVAYHSGYKEYHNEEGFFNKWIISYEGKEEDINWFRDNIGRVREVFEYYNYNYNNDNLWTLASYLWDNEIGEEYAKSIYERECLDDPYYQEMSGIIGELLLELDT